jgi:hypothetical protein
VLTACNLSTTIATHSQERAKTMTYLDQCNRYFAPLDEIAEALSNGEAVAGVSYSELVGLVRSNPDLNKDLSLYEGFTL